MVNEPLFPWLKTLYPVWAKLTPDALKLASQVAMAELLLSGCTTTSDHHYLFPAGMENAIDVQVEVVNSLGMRAMLTRGSMSLGEQDGGLPPQQTVQSGEAILEDSQLIRRYHQRGEGARIQDDEIRRLGAAGVGICHCPVSNMRLASGICPTLELEEAGAIIGLGVDGSASNDASNLMFETRQALYLQRLRYGAKRITPQKVLSWATQGSARLLGRHDLGEIRVGKQADLALFRLDDLRFSGSHDPLSALILCGAERADRVMVGGDWRVVEGEISGLDCERLKVLHREAAKQLVATF